MLVFKTNPNNLLGKQNGPVWLESGSFDSYMSVVGDNSRTSSKAATYNRTLIDINGNVTVVQSQILSTAATTDYWLPELAPLGKACTLPLQLLRIDQSLHVG
jgi:hypothetical protein